jgi:hypothetical protein
MGVNIMSDKAICNLCGEPMPQGEQMFKYHGYSGPCPKPPRTEPSEQRPVYSKFPQDKPNAEGTQLYGISCNEGWRESIVCTGMYEWAADWLLGVLARTPYAKKERP